MKNLRLLIISLFLIFIGSVCLTHAAEKKTYHYKVNWLAIPAGQIELTVIKSSRRTKLIAKAWTTGFVRILLPFESTWTTWLDENGYPRRSRIYRVERGKAVLKEFIYDQKNGKVIRYKNGHKEKEVKLKHYPVHDELSAFYASMNTVMKKPGDEKIFWIFAKNKANQARLKYLKNENIRTPCGRMKTQKMQVTFGFQSELIERSKKAYLWLAQKLVIKAQGELTLGHVTADLTNLPCKGGNK
ncbi:hypothetical protein Thein_1208 [Thermodesulfatator indicus DSM 15286]|uniref:DUF3108 domain-containing protein n=1 Tax=Thermodesulfatator indicus (strain DSM 15286 / JCM 11887 / CIR29812) TaxID=667014 RepID=F8A8J0_THEID|nr:DUF3108 domain-containing protein [Thermodesulfatator indicus]AEH45076.1 hypothetical protein Thein_1208 [Thermodesulfatator indicus DSM 15286]